jgi:hypothetical protein
LGVSGQAMLVEEYDLMDAAWDIKEHFGLEK